MTPRKPRIVPTALPNYDTDVQARVLKAVTLLEAVLILRPEDKAIQALVKTARNHIVKAEGVAYDIFFSQPAKEDVA